MIISKLFRVNLQDSRMFQSKSKFFEKDLSIICEKILWHRLCRFFLDMIRRRVNLMQNATNVFLVQYDCMCDRKNYPIMSLFDFYALSIKYFTLTRTIIEYRLYVHSVLVYDRYRIFGQKRPILFGRVCRYADREKPAKNPVFSSNLA